MTHRMAAIGIQVDTWDEEVWARLVVEAADIIVPAAAGVSQPRVFPATASSCSRP
ncbi:hypothetical protein [Nonomuraea sp. NEAU-A123]|uniref:hypothetical protein n=1 Tax=Nonomuraea sp. NEAU-A123 TaxID=2839649 RepID=UPI001BE459F0|nr:hypothetical protein [Nonomuraea sp. NEAU-A123]MBT2233053.1 hypothetical protein [Nonomuraea sp. NEAU-A123]